MFSCVCGAEDGLHQLHLPVAAGADARMPYRPAHIIIPNPHPWQRFLVASCLECLQSPESYGRSSAGIARSQRLRRDKRYCLTIPVSASSPSAIPFMISGTVTFSRLSIKHATLSRHRRGSTETVNVTVTPGDRLGNRDRGRLVSPTRSQCHGSPGQAQRSGSLCLRVGHDPRSPGPGQPAAS